MQINQIVNVDLVKQMNSAVVYKLIDGQGPIPSLVSLHLPASQKLRVTCWRVG